MDTRFEIQSGVSKSNSKIASEKVGLVNAEGWSVALFVAVM